jgi:hypothetical protein
MSLQGSISGLQETLAKLYLDISQRFSENQVIRDLWSAMAHDLSQQKHSMALLPPSFWHKLKEEQDGFPEAIAGILRQTIDNKIDQSLRNCFSSALFLEEPAILKIYVPMIRKMRENWTEQALDFYIMVKAHIARITRVTQAFAGDPVIIQRSSLLLQHFEKEVQEPQVVFEPPVRNEKSDQHPQPKTKHAAKPQKKTAAKKAPALAKRSKNHLSMTKPLAKKVSLPRRRARR